MRFQRFSYGPPVCLLNPFGGNSSSSTASTDRRIGATDDAQVATEGSLIQDVGVGDALNNSIQAEDAATVISDSSDVNTGLKVTGGVSGSIVVNDAAAFTSLASEFSENLASLAEAQSDNLQDVLASQAALAESAQTDGVSGLSKTFIAVMVVAGLLVAWIAYNRK